MLYIAISILFVWLVPFIFIHITYYFFFCVFFLPLPKYKQISKGTDHNIGHCGLIYFIYQGTISYLGVVAQHLERQVLYISNSIIMVGFISLIFSYYLLLGFPCNIFYSKTKQNNIVESIFSHFRCNHWTQGRLDGLEHC